MHIESLIEVLRQLADEPANWRRPVRAALRPLRRRVIHEAVAAVLRWQAEQYKILRSDVYVSNNTYRKPVTIRSVFHEPRTGLKLTEGPPATIPAGASGRFSSDDEPAPG